MPLKYNTIAIGLQWLMNKLIDWLKKPQRDFKIGSYFFELVSGVKNLSIMRSATLSDVHINLPSVNVAKFEFASPTESFSGDSIRCTSIACKVQSLADDVTPVMRYDKIITSYEGTVVGYTGNLSGRWRNADSMQFHSGKRTRRKAVHWEKPLVTYYLWICNNRLSKEAVYSLYKKHY